MVLLTIVGIVCPAVPSPPNGVLLNSKSVYYSGNSVGYKCNVGYELHGMANRKCVPDIGKEGEWSTPEPICRGMLISLLVQFHQV